MAGLFKPVAAGYSLALRVTPNASRARLDGVATDADGTPFLKVAVTVPPEDGKANEAVIKLLAKDLRLPKSALTIASGAHNRRKVLLIAGDQRELEAKIETKATEWLRLHPAA